MAFPLFFVQSLYPNLVRNTPWVFVAQWVQASLTSSRSLVQIQVKTRFFSFFLLFLINFWCILHMYQTLQIIYDIKKTQNWKWKKKKKKLAWPGFELMTIKSKGRCIDHYTKWSSGLSSQNIIHVLLQHYFSKIFRSQDLRQDLSHFLKKVCHSNPLTKRVTKMVSYLLEH